MILGGVSGLLLRLSVGAGHRMSASVKCCSCLSLNDPTLTICRALSVSFVRGCAQAFISQETSLGSRVFSYSHIL